MNTMNMPGFTGENSLYQTSERYRLNGAFSAVASDQRVTPAQFLCDWFPWLPWCPKPQGDVHCEHTNTDTFCLGFSMWCKDNSRCSDGSTRSSGWYPCGVCIGWG